MWIEQYKETISKFTITELEQELKILRRMNREESSRETVNRLMLVGDIIREKTDEILNYKPNKDE